MPMTSRATTVEPVEPAGFLIAKYRQCRWVGFDPDSSVRDKYTNA
jgi:hypothetical protein